MYAINQDRPQLPILKDFGVKILNISDNVPEYAFNPSISLVNDRLYLATKVFAFCDVKTYLSELNDDLVPIEWNQISFTSDTSDCPPEDVRIITRNSDVYLIGARANHTDFTKYISFSTCVYKLNLDTNVAEPLIFLKELGNFSNKNLVTIANQDQVTFDFIMSHPESVRGGSNLIPYEDGYISIGHKTYIPDPRAGQYRYYSNVLIKYDKFLNIEKISKEFLFENYDVEFATGMIYHKNTFIISYGVNDSECHLAILSKENVEQLWRNNAN